MTNFRVCGRSTRHYSRFNEGGERGLTFTRQAERVWGGRFRGFGSGAVTIDRGWRGAVATMPTCQTSLRVK